MGKETLPEQSIRILAEIKPKAEFYCYATVNIHSFFPLWWGELTSGKQLSGFASPMGTVIMARGDWDLRNRLKLHWASLCYS